MVDATRGRLVRRASTPRSRIAGGSRSWCR